MKLLRGRSTHRFFGNQSPYIALAVVLSFVIAGCSGVSSPPVGGGGGTPDTTPPSVSVTAPATGATLSGAVNVTASASDNVGVASVQFQVDGANAGALLTAVPYGYSWDTTKVSNGSHSVRAVAKDAAGNSTTSAAVTVTVSNSTPDTTPPTASITAPANNATVSGTVSVTANASDNVGVASVQFQVDGANAGSLLTAAPYGYSWDTTKISNGSHSVRAVAKDAAGNSTTSAAVTVSVSNSTPDTTPPTVSITAPANNATVSGTISLTATATDPDSPVSFVQFQVDGANVGSQLTTSPYTMSLDTTTLANGSHTLNAFAKDPAGNQGTSVSISVTVSNTVSTSMGPLKQSTVNPRYFVAPNGKAVLLSGSQTWNSFQDTDQSSSPAAMDFTAYVNFLKAHGHNVTILWKKDLPTYCGWGAGGTWQMTPFPWLRTGGSSGTQMASDGLPAFDFNQFNQAYFDRLRARALQLQQNSIYAIVQLFDGLGLSANRCGNDGYPFTNGNNVNGVDDGGGTGSMTMSSANAITNIQDAYARKVIDTVNDLPNVLWEISEEAPDNSTWWQDHMISLIRSYEAGKPLQHPIGYPTLDVSGSSDATLYNSNADWVAPKARISPTSSCGSGTPSCKVNINDSDHSYFGMWNDSAQTNRNFIWENFTQGDSVMFMDPYVIYWTNGSRNLCSSPVNGVCNAPDTRWNNFRDNMGYMLSYANSKLDLLKITPQGNLSSTGYCLADNVATGAEYLVYAPSGGSFSVNLSATTRVLNVEWLDPSTGTISPAGTVSGGSTLSFTPPFSGDAVLYLVDSNGHN